MTRNVRMLAAARGTTPTEAARSAGMSVEKLHSKLRGRVRWNVEDLEAIAAVLDVAPERLVAEFRCTQPTPVLAFPPRSGLLLRTAA